MSYKHFVVAWLLKAIALAVYLGIGMLLILVPFMVSLYLYAAIFGFNAEFPIAGLLSFFTTIIAVRVLYLRWHKAWIIQRLEDILDFNPSRYLQPPNSH